MKINLLNNTRKFSKREYILFVLLLLILEGYLLFTYLLTPMWQQYSADLTKVKSSDSVSAKLQTDYDKKAEYDSKLQEVNGKLDGLMLQIPSFVSQEEVIKIIDQYSTEKMLSIQLISFDTESAASADGFIQAGSTASTQDVQQQANTPASQQATASGPVVVTQQISIGFSGNYSSIYGFIDALEKNVRKVYVNEISLSKSDSSVINGTMKLSFISYLEDSGNKPFIMDTQEIKGRLDLFKPYSGYAAGGSEIVNTQPQSGRDFYMIINTYLDNAQKIILGEYPKTETEIYSNSNGIVNSKLVLKGNNSKYTYSYSIGDSIKAGQGEITVVNGAIRLDVVSKPRKSGDDKVAVVLDVDNQTGVPLEITVSNDDKALPRFRLGNKTGEVKLKTGV